MKKAFGKFFLILLISMIITLKAFFIKNNLLIIGIVLSVVSLYFLIAAIIMKRKEPEIYNINYISIALICFLASLVLLFYFLKPISWTY